MCDDKEYGVMADYLDECGFHDEATDARGHNPEYVCGQVVEKFCTSKSSPQLSDWGNVFYEPGCGNHGELKIERALPNDDTSLKRFTRADVKEVIALSPGERDETDWLCVGELHDGRFFAVKSGCDYTGWG